MVLKLSNFFGGDRYQFLNDVEVTVVIWFPFKNESSREHLIAGIRKALQID